MRAISFLAAIFLSSIAFAESTIYEFYRPTDNGKALINPDMGWCAYFYSCRTGNYGYFLEPSDTLEWFPGTSVVYMRLPWAFIEPEEGKFNFGVLDTPAQRFIDKGKQIAIRITCTEHWIPWATPKWVKDKGAKGTQFHIRKGPVPDGPCWEPDYLDPVFLKYLDRMVGKLAERYDGNPNVAFIDIGSFGIWGEGHTGFTKKLNAKESFAVAKKHIDIFKKHFKKTQLVISDDVAGSNAPGPHFPATDYALSQGVSLRDDSILVDVPSQKKKSWYHEKMAGLFWEKMPVVLEHEHYGLSKARGAWDGKKLADSVEQYHASYMSIHWWPEQFLKENAEFVGEINKRLGYRLFPAKIKFPTEMEIGEEFPVEFKWANLGVAPCYKGGFPALTIKDNKGGIIAVMVDESLNVKDLPVSAKGSPKYVESKGKFRIGFKTPAEFFNEFTLKMEKRNGAEFYAGPVTPATPAGEYSVYISVGKRDGTPIYELPLENSDGHKRYKIGTISLKEPKTPGVEIKVRNDSPQGITW